MQISSSNQKIVIPCSKCRQNELDEDINLEPNVRDCWSHWLMTQRDAMRKSYGLKLSHEDVK